MTASFDGASGNHVGPTKQRIASLTVHSLVYALGMLVLLVLTLTALHISPVNGISQLWTGAVGGAAEGRLYPLSATLVESAPLLLAAISVCISWRAGLFSIGAQGQILIGGLAATAIYHSFSGMPPPVLTCSMIVCAAAGGSLWGLIAGWMRVYRGVQEVISTIMLNYIALYIVSWLVLGPLRAKGNYLAETDSLPNSVLFARLIPASWSDHIQTTLHVGVLLAILASPLAYLFLFRTRSGFNMRILGSNDDAARAARLPANTLKLWAMAISGGIAGLAGAILLLGSATGSLPATSFGGSIGFTAIPVALLGGLHPIGSLLSAFFFGGLTQGCRNLEQNTGVSSVVIYVIQATAVLAVVGAPRFSRAQGDGAGMSILVGAVEGFITMSTPLLFAALGETIVQRSGVVNVGLEGLVLTGALAGVLGVWQTHSPAAGLVCAVVAAGLFSMIFALFAVKLAANQVVVGVVVNLMALGITGTINRQVFGRQQTFVSVAGLPHLFANQTLLTPLALICVPSAWWWLYKTRGGLQLRATGEQPQAAEAAGVNVARLRTLAVLFGGVMAGIAGACLTLGDVPTFQEGMSAGRGFIALAIVTAGRWNPYGCLAASLVFGVSEELEIQGQAMGLHVPHDILLALPYMMTLVILMTGSKLARAPAALGVEYRRP